MALTDTWPVEAGETLGPERSGGIDDAPSQTVLENGDFSPALPAYPYSLLPFIFIGWVVLYLIWYVTVKPFRPADIVYDSIVPSLNN